MACNEGPTSLDRCWYLWIASSIFSRRRTSLTCWEAWRASGRVTCSSSFRGESKTAASCTGQAAPLLPRRPLFCSFLGAGLPSLHKDCPMSYVTLPLEGSAANMRHRKISAAGCWD